jgi:hypothetical protein
MAENSKISPDSSSNLGFDARLWLAIMNLALRGIEADFGPENADTFRRDFHLDLPFAA